MPGRLARAALHQRSSVLQTGPPGFRSPRNAQHDAPAALAAPGASLGQRQLGTLGAPKYQPGTGYLNPKLSMGVIRVLLRSPSGGFISLRDTLAEQRGAGRGRAHCKGDQTGRFFCFRNGNEENICFVSGITKGAPCAGQPTRARFSLSVLLYGKAQHAPSRGAKREAQSQGGAF